MRILINGGGKSPTFTTSNSEKESKIKFYFLLHQCKIQDVTTLYDTKSNK